MFSSKRDAQRKNSKEYSAKRCKREVLSLTNEEFQRLVLEKLTNLDSDVKGLKASQNRFESELQKVSETVIRIENVHGEKLNVLFDGWKQHDEKINLILQRLDTIEEKLDRHDIQISVLDRRAKRI